MSSPASHSKKSTEPEHFPPVPDGAIPTQRTAEPGVHRATGSGRGKLAAGLALLVVVAVGFWIVQSPSGTSSPGVGVIAGGPDSGLRQLLLPVDAGLPPVPGQIPDGSFAVGSQVQPGVYRTQGTFPLVTLAGCNWRVGDGAEVTGPLLTSGTTTGPTTVTIRPADRTFTSSGCQTWVKVG
jgi:hypothetical protein